MAEALEVRTLQLSLHIYGCRVVQKALEVFDPERRLAIASILEPHTLRCVADQHANHVIQMCLQCVQPTDGIRGMAEGICKNALHLARHPYGCRLVQRVLQHCTLEEIHSQVATALVGEIEDLSMHEYGNYVIQHLVVGGPEDARQAVYAHVIPLAASLGRHKYASNLMEKCLDCGTEEQRAAIVANLLEGGGPGAGGAVHSLARDQYGNYVLQKALEVASAEDKEALLAALRPHVDNLRKSTFGKHIAATVNKMLRAPVRVGSAAAVDERPSGAGGVAGGGDPGAQPHSEA